jgi:hypothetical protein
VNHICVIGAVHSPPAGRNTHDAGFRVFRIEGDVADQLSRFFRSRNAFCSAIIALCQALGAWPKMACRARENVSLGCFIRQVEYSRQGSGPPMTEQ